MSEKIPGEAEVAFKLFEYVLTAEEKRQYTGDPISPKNMRDEVTPEDILKTFRDCLAAVRGS
jgi:hypothetical protein